MINRIVYHIVLRCASQLSWISPLSAFHQVILKMMHSLSVLQLPYQQKKDIKYLVLTESWAEL